MSDGTMDVHFSCSDTAGKITAGKSRHFGETCFDFDFVEVVVNCLLADIANKGVACVHSMAAPSAMYAENTGCSDSLHPDCFLSY